MPGPAATQITVRAGAAEPGAMDLRPGQAVGPLSIGRQGTWRVVAPGVLAEHGFVYFNGTQLFLQSTDPNTPLLADGAPIPLEWTAIYAPCEIAVGGALLWFGTPHDATRPMRAAGPRQVPAVPQPPPRAQPAQPGRQEYAPRVRGNDNEEATRVAPMEELAAMRARGPQSPPTPGPSFGAPAPSFGAPAPSFGAPAPSFGAPPMGTPSFGPAPFVQAPPAPQPVVAPPVSPEQGPPGAAPKKQSWIGARWREASGPKKGLMVLMAPLVWAVWVIFTDKPLPPAPPRPATSASPSARASAGSTSAEGALAAPPVPSGSGSARVVASAGPATSPATTGAKTPQREAADAVAAGAYDRAATLYEELARAHPEVPAYGEAARIMKAKAGKR